MRKLLAIALFLTSATIFAQGTITGTVIDSEMDAPLPGANVRVSGTDIGTTTDFNGEFSLNVQQANGTVEVSFLGFEKRVIPFRFSGRATVDLGNILLSPDADALEEVIITSYSLAIDRQTPVAVSTIRAEEIETRLGNQEFPEILRSTPGVYATKGGGGFGDAELRLRGFNSENIAVMINGIPVNDMENGRVYWSNWAGLSDVTRTMQVQRGLGAARVAVPSIGGTVNILTRTTDAVEGGNVIMQAGNDNRQKYGATVSTGKLENGFAATVSASRTTGDGYIDGTQFEAYNYFVNVAKDFGDDHQISFTAFGAPQWHGQRQTAETIETYLESERGTRFNRDWGYRDGQVVNIEDNFYHKPQISLNHFWNISDATSLSTAAYASFGTGGGGGYSGVNKFGLGSYNNPSPYRDGYLQPVNVDLIVEENVERGALGSETWLRASRNNHNWYGVLSTLATDITEDIELIGGVDLRYYNGEHYTELTDLLGGRFAIDNGDVNRPNRRAQVGDKISYYDEGFVLWEGLFAQAEYARDDLSAFISVAASNTSYKRIDYFSYLNTDPDRETDYIHFFGYSAKGGANFNLTEQHNIFANVGYFEKAPFFDAVFLNFVNDVNEDAANQKIFSAELGYGFRTHNWKIDLNAYWTRWRDRTLTQSFRNPDDTFGSANILGVNALHQGIELEASYRPIETLTLTGMASIGDWRWQNNVLDVPIFNDEQQQIGQVDLYIEDLKVGGSAQNTFALGADFEALPGTFLRADWSYFDDLYADFDPNTRNSPDLGQSFEVPAYGLLDFGLTHNFEFGGFDARLMGNLYNALDTTYIAVARDSGQYFYGFGRTFSLGVKINF